MFNTNTLLVLNSIVDPIKQVEKVLPKLGLKNVEKMTECIITKDDPQTVANGYGSAKLVLKDGNLSLCVYKGFVVSWSLKIASGILLPLKI